MGSGRFVVLAGVDGAGTSTQLSLLGEALKARGHPVHLTREPSDGPIGVLIRQMLSHRVVVPGPSGPRFPRMETMALLFAADRVDHLECEISPNLHDGVTVLCDRYIHSSIAYQTLTASRDDRSAEAWVLAINARAPWPDLVVVLDLPPEEAAARRASRGGPEDVYEQEDLQVALGEFYRNLPQRYPDQAIAVIDASGDIHSVHEAVLGAVLDYFEQHPR